MRWLFCATRCGDAPKKRGQRKLIDTSCVRDGGPTIYERRPDISGYVRTHETLHQGDRTQVRRPTQSGISCADAVFLHHLASTWTPFRMVPRVSVPIQAVKLACDPCLSCGIRYSGRIPGRPAPLRLQPSSRAKSGSTN